MELNDARVHYLFGESTPTAELLAIVADGLAPLGSRLGALMVLRRRQSARPDLAGPEEALAEEVAAAGGVVRTAAFCYGLHAGRVILKRP